MYAIREATNGHAVSIRSADQCQEWWSGRQWTPASDEAKTFDTETEAAQYAEEHVTRAYAVVEIE